jgi:flavodoxin
MRAVVIYESMYGNTRLVADAIADGLRSGADVSVLAVDHVDAAALADVDLVVVGGPTHVHGMTRASTRRAAAEAAEKPGSGLEMDADAEGEGLREWFDSIGSLPRLAGAFDTRMHGPVTFTGRASKGIAKRLRAHGSQMVVEPESFLVSKENHLDDDECEHARKWGATVLRSVPTTS